MYNVCIIIGSEVVMKKRVNISLDEEIADQIKILAKDSHRNVSQWITDAVCDAMENSNMKSAKGKKSGQNSNNK